MDRAKGHWRGVCLGAALALVALLAGCAASAPKRLAFDVPGDGAAAQHVWPAPPEVPRYRYVGQLRGEDNFRLPDDEGGGIGGFLRALGRWIVGELRSPDVLLRPQAGVVDAKGNIYVTDGGRGGLWVFDVPAGELRMLDWAESQEGFSSPVAVAAGPGGDMFVADSQRAIVARLDARGDTRPAIGRGQLVRPTGLAYDPKAGHLYVCDTGAHDIKVFDDAGRHVKTIGRRGEGEGEFNFPTYIAFARGELYVTDTMNSRVQVLDPDTGAARSVFGKRGLNVGSLVRPKGIAVDSEGHIYVIESYYDHLLVFNREGALLLAIGGTGQGPGKFDLPSGVWVDGKDRVYVADMLNGRVVVMQFLGGGAR